MLTPQEQYEKAMEKLHDKANGFAAVKISVDISGNVITEFIENKDFYKPLSDGNGHKKDKRNS